MFALETEQTPSATPIEFAAALADVLSRAGVPVLHSLVERAAETDIVQLLQTIAQSPHKVDLRVRGEDASKGTVLHIAASKGFAAAVHYLMVLGCDPESSEEPIEVAALDSMGRSPLELAVECGSVETTKVLLEAGCVVNQKMVRQAVLGESVELAGLLVTRLSEGSVAAGEMLRGVLASLYEIRNDPVATEKLERAAELLVGGGVNVDEEMLDAAIASGSGRVVSILAGAAPGSVDLWQFGIRCVRELISDMKHNHEQHEDIHGRCALVAKEQQEVHESLWGKRAQIANTMLEQKLDRLKLDLAQIPTAGQLAVREIVCAELLRGGQQAQNKAIASSDLAPDSPTAGDPMLEAAERKLAQMIADQPAGWPESSRIGAVVNIAKVHGDKMLLQLAKAKQQSALSTQPANSPEAKALDDSLQLGIELAFMSHRSTSRLSESDQLLAPAPEAVLQLILAGEAVPVDAGEDALRRSVKGVCAIRNGQESHADIAAWHHVIKVLLHGGANPTSVDTQGVSALSHAIEKEDEGTIALLVEHAQPEFQKAALDALVAVLVDSNMCEDPVVEPAVSAAKSQLEAAQQLGDPAAVKQAEKALADAQAASPSTAAGGAGSSSASGGGGANEAAQAAFFDIAQSHTADKAFEAMAQGGGGKVLLRACEAGDLQWIHNLLEQGMSAASEPGLLQTILGQMYHCPMEQQLGIAKELVDANADVNGADANHTFPIQSAIDLDNAPLLDMLLECGANPSVGNMLHYVLSKMLLNTRGSPKWELLQSMLDMLVEHRAEPLYHGNEFSAGVGRFTQHDGYYPLDLALVLDNTQIVWLLKLSGAEEANSFALHALLAELTTEKEVELGHANMTMIKDSKSVWTATGDQHGPVWGTVKTSTNAWGKVKSAGIEEMQEGERALEKIGQERNMEVPVTKLQIISVKTMGHVLGNRPSVPIGGCSLKKWKQNNTKLLSSSLDHNKERGVMIEYTLDVSEGQVDKNTPCVTVFQVHKEEAGEVLPVPLYRGYVRSKTDATLVAQRLADAREEYLRFKALSLVYEAGPDGVGLKFPIPIENVPTRNTVDGLLTSTPLKMATEGGATEIAKALVKKPGVVGIGEVMGLLDSLPTDFRTSGEAADKEVALVNELLADALPNAEMAPEDIGVLLERGIKGCMVAMVEATLMKDSALKALKEQPYCHQTLQALSENPAHGTGYRQIMRLLLASDADPNRVYRNKTSLLVALTPPINANQVACANSLIEFGAKFTDPNFTSILDQWESSDPLSELCALFEAVVGTMIAKDPKLLTSPAAQVRRPDGPKSLLTIAVEKNSGMILAQLFAGHKAAIIAKEPAAQQLLEPYTSLLIGLSKGTVELSGDEDGEEATHLKIELADTLSHADMPVLQRVLDKDMTGTSLLDLLDEICAEGTVDLSTTNDKGMTILHEACAQNHIAVARKLLELTRQLELNNPDTHDSLPASVHDCLNRTALSIAVGKGSIEMVTLLTSGPPEGFGVNVEPGLLYPAILKAPKVMVDAMINGEVRAIQSDFNRSVLHGASLRTGPDAGAIATSLLEHGADKEARDIDGATPLMLAVKQGNAEVIQVLLANGADALAEAKDGSTPVKAALSGSGDNPSMTSLALEMLDAVGPSVLENDQQVVLEALRNKNEAVLSALNIDASSDTILYGEPGKPLVWWAAFFGHTDKLLELASAMPLALDHANEANGRTLWHYMAVWGSALGAFEELLSREVPSNVASQSYDTLQPKRIPLELAAIYGRAGMVHALAAPAPVDVITKAGTEAHFHGMVAIDEYLANLHSPASPDGSSSSGPPVLPTSLAQAAELAELNNTPFRDPTFEAGLSALGPASVLKTEYSEIEWIRCSELCGSDAVLFGPMIPTAGKAHYANPLLLTICSQLFNSSRIQRLFVEQSATATGKYTVNAEWEGRSEQVVIDDMIPVLGASSEPEAAFGTVGAKNEMWFHLWLKGIAKMVGGYGKIFGTDTTAISEYTREQANTLVPGADAQQLAALGPVLQLNKMARAIVPRDEVSDEALVTGIGRDLEGAQQTDIAPAAGAAATPDIVNNTTEVSTLQVTVHASDSMWIYVDGIVPDDIAFEVTSLSGQRAVYGQGDQVDLEETDSPYEIVMTTAMPQSSLKPFDWDLDYISENMTVSLS